MRIELKTVFVDPAPQSIQYLHPAAQIGLKKLSPTDWVEIINIDHLPYPRRAISVQEQSGILAWVHCCFRSFPKGCLIIKSLSDIASSGLLRPVSPSQWRDRTFSPGSSQFEHQGSGFPVQPFDRASCSHFQLSTIPILFPVHIIIHDSCYPSALF